VARIGIDLGTTNTVAAMVYDDGAHVIPRGRGRVIPSAVHFRWQEGDGDVVVGEEAEKWMAAGRVVRSVKRLMGRTHSEALREGSDRYFRPQGGSVRLVRRGENDVGLAIGGGGVAERTLWPHEVSAWVLREARAHAERSLGRPIEAAAITVPAYFRDPHRAATLDAARLAGVEVWGELLDEPSAAALAFAPVVGFRPGEPVLVVDWGGGTLDVTVQMSRDAHWYQAAIGGDLVLGGDDLDLALAEWALVRAGLGGDVLADEQNRWMLLQAARHVKETLSSRDEATFTCAKLADASGTRLRPIGLAVGRPALDEVMAPFVERALRAIETCLEAPDASRAAIRKVLLVGGSTRIPLFRRRLAALLPEARLHDEVDPMQAVALGAAAYAHSRPTIARISAFGYALVGDDDSRLDVIPPRSDVPTPAHIPFGVAMKTRYAGQTVYRLTVAAFEEDRDGRRYNEPRRLFARGAPPSAVDTPVDVELWLDENKDLRARCHVQGHGAQPMEGREDAEGELFTRLFNATLDGEALLEANQRNTTGLLPSLRRAVEWARAVDQTRDRAQAEQVLQQLKDLRDQVDDKNEVIAQSGMPPEDAARRRVAGWVWYYEQQLLPHFWEALPEAQRQQAIERLRALRVQLQTGASAEELDAGLRLLKEGLCSGDLELPVRAWVEAGLLGVPDRLSTRLREQATLVRDHLVAHDRAGVETALDGLRGLMAEADQAWRAWHETGFILDARPDLVLVKPEHGRAN
jgi:actin-like ATPase involved in cell morphogenesis